jgi:hypothetical protein
VNQNKNNIFVGIILITIGILILMDNIGFSIFSWEFIRSIGFILVGFFLLLKNYYRTRRKNTYIGTFFLLMGIYYTFAELGVIYCSTGMTLSILTINLGLAFYGLFLLGKKDWSYIFYGNLIIILGLFFLLEYLRLLPPYLFICVVDNYWPVLIITIGIIIAINGFYKKKRLIKNFIT